MYFASSVAVAVASGMPGMGKVTTGLLPSHVRDVLPTVVSLSLSSVPGLGPISLLMSAAAMIAAFGAPCGLAQKRMMRSCTAAGIGVALPLPAMISAPGVSSFHAYPSLSTSIAEYA